MDKFWIGFSYGTLSMWAGFLIIFGLWNHHEIGLLSALPIVTMLLIWANKNDII